MTINTNTTKNAIELRTELLTNGSRIEHIIIDGKKVGILGATSEADKQNALRTLEAALKASNGNIYEMMRKLNTIATIEDNNINPDEVITVCGEEFVISYTNKTAYDMNGEPVVNCTDLPDMPNEAIKAVLTARIEALN